MTNNKKITLISHSPEETQDIAGKICLQNWEEIKKNGLIIGLDGNLGAGKTIFAKGVAKFLHITDLIKSPTYNYFFEYEFNRHNIKGNLIHYDAWKIDTKQDLQNLGFTQQIKPKNIILVEWWEQIEKYTSPWPSPINKRGKPKIIKIKIKELAKNKRKLEIYAA